MSSFIQSGHEHVGDLLSRNARFCVPEHQRDYAWTEDETSQFWDDLRNAQAADSEHFLGPIVLRQVSERDYFEIIDGQQRLATTLVLLAAIRNTYHEHGDDYWQDIQNTYFGKRDIRTRELEPKFSMNSVNDIVYRDYIVSIQPDKAIETFAKRRTAKATNKKLLDSYLFFKEKIDDVTMDDKGHFSTEVLADIKDQLDKKLSVIQIIVSDEADAFTLFETLNERGIDLSILDLLKNHLFRKAGSSIEAVKRNWISTTENLDENVGLKFIRHFWVSRYGRIQAGRLYRELRNSVTKVADSVSLSKDLAEDSYLYSALGTSDHPLWDGYTQSLKDDISVVRLLNAAQCLPVLMAAYRRFDKPEFEKVVRQMVVMSIRYGLICGLRTGALELKYAEIAAGISGNSIKKAASCFRSLSDLYPSDQTFSEAFSKREIRTAKHARYLLRELEVAKRGGEVGPVEDTRSVSLEHIAPKNRNEQWRNIGNMHGEGYEYWVFRLGNQVLLGAGDNRAQAGQSFEKKRRVYEKSPLILTKVIGDNSVWTTKEIDERQARLADIAVNVWSYAV